MARTVIANGKVRFMTPAEEAQRDIDEAAHALAAALPPEKTLEAKYEELKAEVEKLKAPK